MEKGEQSEEVHKKAGHRVTKHHGTRLGRTSFSLASGRGPKWMALLDVNVPRKVTDADSARTLSYCTKAVQFALQRCSLR